jgi:hypothetical protein
VASLIVYTKGGTQIFPIPFGTFSNAAIVLVSASSITGSVAEPPLNFDPAPSRDVAINNDVKIESRVHPIFNKIVMIMDSLNGAVYNTTPFLKATDHLVNFGVANSGANCSIISRTMFRFGMRQSDLPNGWHEGLNRPTFWQFAHRAGYKTVHIDAWYGPLTLGNGLSLAERALIDSNINIINNPSYLRDQMLVDQLFDTLKDGRPAFIYVEKFGVHFPYSDKYPPNFHALPTPLESHTHRSVDTILGLHRFDELTEHEIAHYPNAIAWSVDEFFRKLLPVVDLSNTLIVYTSDHGQSLLPGRFPHCSMAQAVPRGEEYVPLFAITSMPEFEQGLEKGAAHGFDQFGSFATLAAMRHASSRQVTWPPSVEPLVVDGRGPNVCADHKLTWMPAYVAGGRTRAKAASGSVGIAGELAPDLASLTPA